MSVQEGSADSGAHGVGIHTPAYVSLGHEAPTAEGATAWSRVKLTAMLPGALLAASARRGNDGSPSGGDEEETHISSLGHVCALGWAGCKEREDVLQPVAPARLIAGRETLDLRVMGSPPRRAHHS